MELVITSMYSRLAQSWWISRCTGSSCTDMAAAAAPRLRGAARSRPPPGAAPGPTPPAAAAAARCLRAPGERGPPRPPRPRRCRPCCCRSAPAGIGAVRAGAAPARTRLFGVITRAEPGRPGGSYLGRTLCGVLLIRVLLFRHLRLNFFSLG